MERRFFVRGAGMAGVLAAGGRAGGSCAAALRWRLTSSFPKSLDTLFGRVRHVFAAKVKDMSGGKFRSPRTRPGELVPAPGTIDAVKDGTVEMANTAPYYYFGKDETFALSCAIPFGLNSRQMTAWYYDGNGLKLMREFYRELQHRHFPMGNTGAQMGGWYRKEIKSIADMKGLKFRVGGFAGKVAERIGVRCRRTSRAARSTRRWKRARSTRPSGWARTTTRSSASTEGGAVLRLPGLVGRRPAARAARQRQGLRRAARAEHKAIIEAACGYAPHGHAGQVRRQECRPR